MTTPSLQHQAMWLLEKRVALLGLRQKRHRVHRSTNLKGIVNFLAVTQVESTFYGFKRLLGRKAGDPRITAEMGGRPIYG